MDDGFQQQLASYQHRLDHLVREGLDLRRTFTTDPNAAPDFTLIRAWQRECAATIGQLSGGSKQHWLSRAYSDAFLLRGPGSSGESEAIAEARVDAIIERIISVLNQAQASLAGMRGSTVPGFPPTRPKAATADLAAARHDSERAKAGQGSRVPQFEGSKVRSSAPSPTRFDFVNDRELRPALGQAFAEAQAALDRGAYGLALVTWASILEAIVTDALQQRLPVQSTALETHRSVSNWTFEARIGAAEQSRMISGGCARLPAVARRYRELLDQAGELRPEVAVGEREAKVTGQVLRLIMRDLAPGR
ncbi:MAG: hypothetical protein ACRD2N_15420 [Vicinamibacterales bacterium]